MKELTKKVLELGLIDKHTATLMERWGFLEPGVSWPSVTNINVTQIPTSATFNQRADIRKVLEEFVEELELLLQPEALDREVVRLDNSEGGE